MTTKEENFEVTEKNKKTVLDTIKRVTVDVDRKIILAVHVFLHALMHKSDPTAVAAGLMAAKHADESRGTMQSPVDCILGILVTVHGFENVANWTDEQYSEAMDNMNEGEALEAAVAYIAQDMKDGVLSTIAPSSGDSKSDEDQIDALMAMSDRMNLTEN